MCGGAWVELEVDSEVPPEFGLFRIGRVALTFRLLLWEEDFDGAEEDIK